MSSVFTKRCVPHCHCRSQSPSKSISLLTILGLDETRVRWNRLPSTGFTSITAWVSRLAGGLVDYTIFTDSELGYSGCSTLSALANATILYNVVDSPVGCIPVTHVDPAIDQLTDEWVHGPGLGSPIIEGRLYRGKAPVYDPVKMKGLPIGVQMLASDGKRRKFWR